MLSTWLWQEGLDTCWWLGLIARGRRVVVEVDDLPARFLVLDRHSGECLPEGNDHPETAAIKPFIYTADGPDAASL